MSQPLTKVWTVLRERGWRLLVYVGLLAIAFALERTGDQAGGQGSSTSEAARVTYQRASTLGYRKPSPQFTALILLNDLPDSHGDPQSVALNACQRRLYLAKLIQALDVQRASVIVLDFYLQTKCPDEDKALSDAISATVQDLPVLLGQYSETVRTIRRQEPEYIIGPGIDGGDLVPEAPNISGGLVGATYGLTMLAADSRRIPLRWMTATPGSDVAHITERHVQDGLAFAAAAAHNPRLRSDPRLNDYMKRGDFPMTSFIPEDKFPQQTGLDLLCKDQRDFNWTDCSPKHDPASVFQGRIAVIGFGHTRANTDIHDSVLGFVPGVILQANYIESLLDGRYLTQAWWPIQVVLSFLCFATIEVVFEFISNIWRAIALAVFVTVIFYLICYVAVIQFGYYLDLWIPSALALILKVISTMQRLASENPLREKNQSA
jgi:CHASE2 domain-containing sensor protein